MAASALIGAWRLVSWTDTHQDGQVRQPAGEAPKGYLVYSEDGFMSATIMAAGRERLIGPSRHMNELSPEESAAVLRGFPAAYCGRYELLEDGVVVHHVEVSLNPNTIGQAGRRHYELDGQTLTISAQIGAQGEIASRLVWTRATA